MDTQSSDTKTNEVTAVPKVAPKKRKRGQGEGTIVKRADGRWVAVLNLGYVDGKRKRKSFYGKTRAEVAALLTAAHHDQTQGITPTDGRLTVTAYLDRWLTDKVQPSVSPSTYRSYKDATEKYIVPAIGRIRHGNRI